VAELAGDLRKFKKAVMINNAGGRGLMVEVGFVGGVVTNHSAGLPFNQYVSANRSKMRFISLF
jgi:hypothetical protein